ncbi:MAG: ATPase domain-containing protein [Bacillota bacterium]|nr:ATPase domain-containing protein [Bacillota bacterium]MDW7684217.1 ATPase domain-containing protein [Bacillota bacterium]
MTRIETGIQNLDTILHGGIPEGSTVLLAGRPGSGKTILAHQIMFHNAAPESKALFLTTLSEPQVKVMHFQQEFGFFDKAKFQNTVIYHDMGSIIRKRGAQHAILIIDELLRKHQPRLVVIDTIKTISEMIPSLVEYREFLLDLSLRLTTWGCTTLLLGEYSEEDMNIRPESAIADGIIYLNGVEEKRHQKRYLRILKMRGTNHISGENFFRITDQGIEVFPRLKPDLNDQSYRQTSERISTGLPQLDEMTAGGIPRGSTTLVSGASGTGKTLLALHFIYAGLLAGESVLFVTFEENPQQILHGTSSMGLDLHAFINSDKLHFLYVSPMELNVDEHIFDIQNLAEECGVSRIVIDSISSFELGMTDKVKYTDYIWAMTDYFKVQGINVLLTHEMHDSQQVTELTKHGISFVADNVILLRYLEQGFDIKRYLRVVKMRSSNHANNLRELKISSKGVRIGSSPS